MSIFPLENPQFLTWFIVAVTLWTIPWKAMALWRSARKGQVGWFVFFILINTVGIMEIIYLRFLSDISVSSLEIGGKARRKRLPRDENSQRREVDYGKRGRKITNIVNPRRDLVERRRNLREG